MPQGPRRGSNNLALVRPCGRMPAGTGACPTWGVGRHRCCVPVNGTGQTASADSHLATLGQLYPPTCRPSISRSKSAIARPSRRVRRRRCSRNCWAPSPNTRAPTTCAPTCASSWPNSSRRPRQRRKAATRPRPGTSNARAPARRCSSGRPTWASRRWWRR
jgi:hypothetical protein